MLRNDSVQNTLYSANSKKSNKNLTPIRESSILIRSSSSKALARSISTANTKISRNGTSRKAIKIIKPETIKRANNDAWMAAAIGDLEWLKNSLKISSEVVFDKNGFATLHLACIHGRLNIVKYLIEEQNMDINLASTQGWRPIHLCINNNIGSKAVDCLKYLISKKADINVKNNDGTYPLHMAASDGQVECLKILLELKADTRLMDNRGQTALDLAKLWGHRNCAKYLNNEMWWNETALLTKENLLERQQRSQNLLKQVKDAYDTYYEDKELSDKNFEDWLVNHVNVKAATPRNNKPTETFNCSSNSTIKLFDDQQTKPKTDTILKSAWGSVNQAKPTQKLRPLTDTCKSESNWNFSTKTSSKPYTADLSDFYPRDQFTCLPTDAELLFLNKELKGQPMIKVKNLIKKDFSNFLISSEGTPERTAVYKPKSVLDAQSKNRKFGEIESRMGGTIKKYASLSCYGDYYNTTGTLKKIKKQLGDDRLGYKDEKLQIVERLYGKDLSDYMTDQRSGKMSQKYEKVFIC